MVGRNTLTGPGLFSFNMGLYKNTQIKERVKLQLRLEMYNVLNHSNFYVNTVDADAGSNNYIDGYRDGHRDVQLGAKIVF